MPTVAPAFAGTARFELKRQIGQGGFGVVYEAFDHQRSRPVALKVLRHAEGAALYRFKREFRALADIEHPNLITLEELLTDGRHWFFTMELVDGEPVLSYLRPLRAPGDSLQSIDVPRLRVVLPQLINALTTLHSHGIVHCDIKPSNVLVTATGRVVVLDFGLVSEPSSVCGIGASDSADLTAVFSVLGTPAYMAPEQSGPERATPAADWYSVGVIVYEALTGRRPFLGTPLEQFEAKQTERPISPRELAPEIPPALSDACMALLEPDPLNRADSQVLLQAFGPAPAPILDGDPGSADDDLLGRDSHFDALADAFAAASEGWRQTVVALVSGRSGMGKTSLVRQFVLQQRACTPRLLTLSSRCYERESMPYKAIDPLIDELSRHLQRLRDIEVARLLPKDAVLLARMFPVLRAVDEFNRAPDTGTAGLDSVTLRHRAATALRDLLSRIGASIPLIVSIDDAQWGDADSAAVLEQVLWSADSPPLLLIASYRSEDADSAPLVAALNRLGREPGSPLRVELTVDALRPEDTRRLASRLASSRVAGQDLTEVIARESGGSPFFVHELARHAVLIGGPTRLDAVVRERVLSLPEATRHLMSVVAVSVQALPPAVAEAAGAVGPAERSPLQLLRSVRLIRTSGGGSQPTIEPYHDRIREAVVAHLSTADLATCHRRLAEAWEQSGVARPDTLATHYAGAGNSVRASHYAEKAAEVASDALAFDRAAGFYRLLLELDTQPTRRRTWLIKLGDALVNAGRGYDAAMSYLKALELGDAEDSLELESRATAELIRAGYLKEATAALERLLPKVGVRPPGSSTRSVATLVWYRLLIALRGVGIRERAEDGVPRRQLQRIDVLIAVGAPLSLIALPQGLSLNMQASWHALRAGERRRAAIGTAMLAAGASMRGTRSEPAAMRLVSAAKALAAPLGDPYTTARTLLAEGICLKVSGRWRDGIVSLERAIELFSRCPGSRWEIETAQTLIHDSLIWTGEWRRLASELPARRQEAEQRGDRYAVAHAAGRLGPLLSLVADRPAQALVEAEAAASQSTVTPNNLQARAALCAWLDIDLYSGEPRRAAGRLGAAWRHLRGTLVLFQSGRIEVEFYRARIALALAAAGEGDALRRAAESATRLEREQANWAAALALLVRAAVARGSNDDDRAANLLEAAHEQLELHQMRLYAAAAAYRRGNLLGGETGHAIASEALTIIEREGAVNPLQVVALLCPGSW